MFGLGWLTKFVIKNTCEAFGMDEEDASAIGDIAKWTVRTVTLVGLAEVAVELVGETLVESGGETLAESSGETLVESTVGSNETILTDSAEKSSNVSFGSSYDNEITEKDYDDEIKDKDAEIKHQERMSEISENRGLDSERYDKEAIELEEEKEELKKGEYYTKKYGHN